MNLMKTTPRKILLTTDTHGELERLKKALELAGFDNEQDQLIHLGDCVDRGPDSAGVIEFLIGVRDLIAIKGNHDDWLHTYIKYGQHPAHQYALETFASYDRFIDEYEITRTVRGPIPASHHAFLQQQRLHYTDDQNRFFCHAGFNCNWLIKQTHPEDFYWDRELIKAARDCKTDRLPDCNNFKQIFIGHSPTINFRQSTPIYAAQVVACDTGAVFGGKLSVLDITTDEHKLFQA